VLRRCLLLLAIVLGSLPLISGADRENTRAAAQPDIIVILLDDARAGDIERTMPETQALLPDGT
jgi:hypothetical protein